jgi:regulator of sigma E protease
MLFVHELGHFVFAKRAGVLVREFSIGMGPKVFSYVKGETKYSLRILPIGAYVNMATDDCGIYELKKGKLYGIKQESGIISDIYFKTDNRETIRLNDYELSEELYITGTNDNDEYIRYDVSETAIIHKEQSSLQIAPKSRQFASKSVFARFMSIISGPLFNILLALILFFSIALLIGAPTNEVLIQGVLENSAAEQAQLHANDKLIGINNTVYTTANELIMKLQASADTEVILNIERDGTKLDIPITPVGENGVGKIGIMTSLVYKEIGLWGAVKSSFVEVKRWIGLIIESFRMLFTGKVGMDDLAGPVGIFQITSDAAKAGFISLMNWTAVLSLYLGVFNLLPIPALDGSRLLFLLAEGVRGKPIDPQKEGFIHFVGFAFLMLLIIAVTINDITKLF